MLIVPLKRPPIYCSLELFSPPCHITSPCRLVGLGPKGLAIEENPFPLETNIFSPMTFTLVGYQPVGINPLLLLKPGLLTSKTAKQLLSALAIYKVFSSVLNARPLDVEPGGASGKSAALNVSITFSVCVLMTETELSLALATYSSFPLFDKHNSLGLSPTFIWSEIFLSDVLMMITSSAPQIET